MRVGRFSTWSRGGVEFRGGVWGEWERSLVGVGEHEGAASKFIGEEDRGLLFEKSEQLGFGANGRVVKLRGRFFRRR